jgi:murein DD-endopeptidase MepM/ murein hydrolase activator NlpD
MARKPYIDEPDNSVAPAYDPVVRMPKRMYVPTPDVAETTPEGARTMFMVAGAGAALGASLGAIGLAIVWATISPRTSQATHGVHTAAHGIVEEDAAQETFALDLDAATPEVPLPPMGPVYEVIQAPLGVGRPFLAALRAMGLPQNDAQDIVREFQPLINMRSLQPTDNIALMRDTVTHELRKVEYRRNESQVWAAVREGAGWRGERVEGTLTPIRRTVGFRVGATLAGTLAMERLHPELATRMAEVFPSMGLPPRLASGDVVRLVLDEQRFNGQFFRYGRVHGVDYRGVFGHRRGYWVGISGSRGDFFDNHGSTFERGPLHSPVPGARLSSMFNPHRLHPVLHIVKPHNGVDFAAPAGTPVYAAADGVIQSCAAAGASGNLVLIQHRRLQVQTGYAHLSRFAPGLHAGMNVHAGQLVGYVGSTGRSTGPHLHFSTRRAGLFFDPMMLMGIRRTISQEARLMFDQQVAQVSYELDRIAVDGRRIVEVAEENPQRPAPIAPATLPPLEVGRTGVQSEHETPEGDGEEPLEESERPM